MDAVRELALNHDGHIYLFRFDAASHRKLIQVLGRFAANPELNFSWHDAAVLCQRARKQMAVRTSVPPVTQGRMREVQNENPSQGPTESGQ